MHPKTNFSPNSSIFEGLINGEVHLVALVVSSRPGLTLPTHSAESPWTQLEMLEHNDSEAVLLKLCGENRRTFERAMELCSTFKFPKYIFWYSLLVIEAESMDPTKSLATSQFDFLGGLLLRSIKVTKDKRASLDSDQSAVLNEDATYLLHLVGLIAYISKALGTTNISELEQNISLLITDMSFPKSIIESRGSIIKKLLPVLQFCHCCSTCRDDSLDKFIAFDHQIVYDYLVANFMTKTILKQSHPSLIGQLIANPVLALDWRQYIQDTVQYDSKWIQVMHLIADALPVSSFITTIRSCSEDEAKVWINSVLNHPKCRDISNPTLSFVKMLISCIFNASRKSIISPANLKKKQKYDKVNHDDNLTKLAFELALKVFKQPLIGQLIMSDICQFKSISLLYNEFKTRSLDQLFVDVLIDKFNMTEQRYPKELVSIIKQLHNVDVKMLMERLFFRLSSRCADEVVNNPVRQAIHHIFIEIFKEDLCADYLIEKLHSNNELEEASAMAVLSSFEKLHLDRVKKIIELIKPLEVHQRAITALPKKLPFDVFDDLVHLLLECPSTLWMQIWHALWSIDDESDECCSKFFSLFFNIKTYLIAITKFRDNPNMQMTEDQVKLLIEFHNNPHAFFDEQQMKENYISINNLKKGIASALRHQALHQEQKELLGLVPEPWQRTNNSPNLSLRQRVPTLSPQLQSVNVVIPSREEFIMLLQSYIPFPQANISYQLGLDSYGMYF